MEKQDHNSHCVGFDPVAQADAQILILGSLPGRKSLQQSEYYAHPRNSFWMIIQNIFPGGGLQEYSQRLAQLQRSKVALWDVARSCLRTGSLDSAIKNVVANDFSAFYIAHPKIRLVCCNGKKAWQLYKSKVVPTLPAPFCNIPTVELPSTSPAHASMSPAEKLEYWRSAILTE